MCPTHMPIVDTDKRHKNIDFGDFVYHFADCSSNSRIRVGLHAHISVPYCK